MFSKIKDIQIGTANIFNNYGLNKFRISDASFLLNQLSKKGLKLLDLSNSYSFSMNNINKIENSFELSVKFFFEKKKDRVSFSKLDEYISNIYNKFPNSIIAEILIHNIDNRKSNTMAYIDFYNYIKKTFNNSHQIKFGASIYEVEDYSLLDTELIEKINILQIPCNVFDQNILNLKNSSEYKKFNPSLSLRSIFLQGILLKKFESLPNYFKKFKNNFHLFEDFIEKNKITKLDACINYVKNFNSRLTIGIDSLENLDDIYNSYNKQYPNFDFNCLISNNKNLIDPRLWIT